MAGLRRILRKGTGLKIKNPLTSVSGKRASKVYEVLAATVVCSRAFSHQPANRCGGNNKP